MLSSKSQLNFYLWKHEMHTEKNKWAMPHSLVLSKFYCCTTILIGKNVQGLTMFNRFSKV